MTNPVATYTFLPWLRQGIASRITQKDTFGPGLGAERAAVHVALQVNGQADFVANNVALLGPGDVIGIQPQAVVRTEPRAGTADFEPNYLAAIDFYDEDFPWRYTPAAAAQVDDSGQPVSNPSRTRLRPWIFLIVLEESEFTENSVLAGPLPSITLTGSPAGIFPPPDQTWAWAHVHVSKDITGGGTNSIDQDLGALDALLKTNPDTALSRLICPRMLKSDTTYHAFLIPAFEIGRLAGLGQAVANADGLAPAWGADPAQTQHSVYYRWSFHTASGGDFQYLVDLLKPGPVDERVGVRAMDMQTPGFNVPGLTSGPASERVMGLEGALRSPKEKPFPETWPPASPPELLKGLLEAVNRQFDQLQPGSGTNSGPDPVISPPLYGRWHALQDSLQAGSPGWVNELNADPRLRVSAGFGSQVIQANQEDYMERAWQQVGDVLAANQKIRQFQVSILAGAAVYTRSFKTLDPDQKLALTAQVHSRVMGSPTTLAAEVKASRLPGAALKPAFQRITRPRGPLMRRVAGPQAAGSGAAPAPGPAAKILSRLNSEDGFAAAQPKQAPAKALSLNRLISVANRSVFDVDKIPARVGFVVTFPGGDLPGDIGKTGPKDSSQGVLFRRTLTDLTMLFQAEAPAPPAGQPLDFDQAAATLETALHPARVIPQRARRVLNIPAGYQYIRPTETIAPVMAHPVIDDPMYKALSALSSELLVPNLNLITDNTITLLETDPRFIEAYMAGLNHEFARELLWREYPTDLRPSTFLVFWEPAEQGSLVRDFKPLHEWDPQTPLGTHASKPLPSGAEDSLVLAVRGKVFKNYPTAMVYARPARWDDNQPGGQVRVLDTDQPILEPTFKAEILPDLRFFGFNLTQSRAKGSPKPEDLDPGWFFVIQERPGEPRFGLKAPDDGTQAAPIHWSELAWNHLGDPNTIRCIDLSKAPVTHITQPPDSVIHWNANAADLAYILFREPVMVAVHAESMLP